MTIPHYDPIIPLPGRIIEDIAPKLDISASLLYLLVRKGHQPSPYTIRRITKATGLPVTIWELPRHETIQRILDALNRSDEVDSDEVDSDEVDSDEVDSQAESELADLF